MQQDFIDFVVNNFEYFCVPFGMLIKYMMTFLESRKEKEDRKKKEELIVKTYEHLIELYERNDDAVEERAQILVKNAILRRDNKNLKSQNSNLTIIVATLRQQVKDLEAKLKK